MGSKNIQVLNPLLMMKQTIPLIKVNSLPTKKTGQSDTIYIMCIRLYVYIYIYRYTV